MESNGYAKLKSYFFKTNIQTNMADNAQTPDAANCHVVKALLKKCHVHWNLPNNCTETFSNDCAPTRSSDCAMMSIISLNMRAKLTNNPDYENG